MDFIKMKAPLQQKTSLRKGKGRPWKKTFTINIPAKIFTINIPEKRAVFCNIYRISINL